VFLGTCPYLSPNNGEQKLLLEREALRGAGVHHRTALARRSVVRHPARAGLRIVGLVKHVILDLRRPNRPRRGEKPCACNNSQCSGATDEMEVTDTFGFECVSISVNNLLPTCRRRMGSNIKV
jgi:hypothetical protein